MNPSKRWTMIAFINYSRQIKKLWSSKQTDKAMLFNGIAEKPWGSISRTDYPVLKFLFLGSRITGELITWGSLSKLFERTIWGVNTSLNECLDAIATQALNWETLKPFKKRIRERIMLLFRNDLRNWLQITCLVHSFYRDITD